MCPPVVSLFVADADHAPVRWAGGAPPCWRATQRALPHHANVAWGEGVARCGDQGRFEPGDFFADPLPKADVVMMGHILHDWDLDQKKHLIRTAYEAVAPGGAFIVYEAIIDDERRTNAFGLLMSLNMLIETPGGFDYTGADCIAWMREAGFRDGYVVHLVGPDSMVVGLK